MTEQLILGIQVDGRIMAITADNEMLHIKDCLAILQKYLKEVLEYDIEDGEVLTIMSPDGTIKWKANEV